MEHDKYPFARPPLPSSISAPTRLSSHAHVDGLLSVPSPRPQSVGVEWSPVLPQLEYDDIDNLHPPPSSPVTFPHSPNLSQGEFDDTVEPRRRSFLSTDWNSRDSGRYIQTSGASIYSSAISESTTSLLNTFPEPPATAAEEKFFSWADGLRAYTERHENEEEDLNLNTGSPSSIGRRRTSTPSAFGSPFRSERRRSGRALSKRRSSLPLPENRHWAPSSPAAQPVEEGPRAVGTRTPTWGWSKVDEDSSEDEDDVVVWRDSLNLEDIVEDTPRPKSLIINSTPAPEPLKHGWQSSSSTLLLPQTPDRRRSNPN
ncbi:hypothetical protein T439DRAFT_324499 [Meredithblackwellia eburnea MCA 4105]